MIIVDECVSREQLEKVLKYMNYEKEALLYINEIFPGIPDAEIIKHLVKADTVLITSDGVLHNKVIRDGKRSIYVDHEGNISNKTLVNVKIPLKAAAVKHTELKENYKLDKTDIHELLMPDSQLQIKKYRTKRRRIRNHFEGIENINNIDVTLSKKEKNSKALIGMHIRIVSNNGMKAIDASENYIMETDDALKNTEEIFFSYALIIIIRLMLNTKKVRIYYDENEIKMSHWESSEYSVMLETIKKYFGEVEYVPVKKGYQIEKMRRKLEQLVKEDVGNEILTEEIRFIKDKLEIHRDGYI